MSGSRTFAKTTATSVVVSLALAVCLRASAQMSASDRRAIHSTYFPGQHYAIDRLLSSTTGDVELDVETSGLTNYRIDPRELSAELVCGSHAIVLGAPTASVSEVTTQRHTIYTEWTVQVEEALRAPASQRLPWKSDITVLLNGGTATVGGRRVTAKNADFPPVRLERRHLFFLRLVEKTGAFVPWFVIDASGERLLSLRPGAFPNLEKADTEEYLSTLRNEAIPAALSSGNCNRENQAATFTVKVGKRRAQRPPSQIPPARQKGTRRTTTSALVASKGDE